MVYLLASPIEISWCVRSWFNNCRIYWVWEISLVYCQHEKSGSFHRKEDNRIQAKMQSCDGSSTSILFTMALLYKILKLNPKSDQYEKIFVFSFLC